jgi:hypothetical protein
MKKILVACSVLTMAFFTVFVFAACRSSAPPPVPPPPNNEEQQPITPVAPGIDVTLSPQPFNPPGVVGGGMLSIGTTTRGLGSGSSWSVIIREPVAPHLPFYQRSGSGAIPGMIHWNGVGMGGELVESAMNYPITVSVTDVNGVTVSYSGHIQVDVLVRDEGGVLRMVIQSIMFGPDRGDFTGIPPDVLASNLRVLSRIAEILNQFRAYSIVVEGHANPVIPPGPAREPGGISRAEEETGSPRILGLQPLSEERAETVMEHLVRLGVERGRLSAMGMGGTRVIVQFENTDNWWRNRRVEFILVR